MQANMGMAGEFRVVVKRADGSTKIDTGYQKNLILNQGLDFFGGDNGSDMMKYCVIGSGNSQPIYTQNKLDTDLAGINGSDVSTKYDYNAARDGSLYKTNKVRKYSFTGLNNVNISEVGIASSYSNTTTYYLCTRALIKDSSGNPTTITVLPGEQLDIYYKLWAVYDTTDKSGTINQLDGAGGSVAYNYKARLANVGSTSYFLSSSVPVRPANAAYRNQVVSSSDLATIVSSPNSKLYETKNATMVPYVPGSLIRTAKLPFYATEANGYIRTVVIDTGIGAWQIRFGSVANDSPITKTNTQTLSIPIEISWGRYEGAL